MDIVSFFKDIATRWNEEQKCGFCWSFSAPLSESGMNVSITQDKCCMHLFITHISYTHGYNTHPVTRLKTIEWCDCHFTLYVVNQQNLGINTYNEIPNHPITESHWVKTLQPLLSCLGCGNEIDLCNFPGRLEITKWQMDTVLNHHDHNYTGWRINGTIRHFL